jgi:hypothetical protein
MDVPFRPRIQSHDWPGRAQCVHRSVCWLPRLAGTPWVSLYFEMSGRLQYIGDPALGKLGMTAQQLETAAVAAMTRTPARWEPLEGAPLRAIQIINEEYACERILDRELLRAGARALNSAGLAVAIPQRGQLVAVPLKSGFALMPIAAALHATAQNPAISPWVFAVQDGQVTGRFFDENGEKGMDTVVPPQW